MRKNLSLLTICYLLLATYYLLLTNCWAVGNLKLGPVKIHPRLGISQNYDDNIYLDAAGLKESFIITITPGLALNIGKRKHKLAFDYQTNWLRYSENPKKNNALNHTLGGSFNLNFKNSGFFKLKDKYLDTSDPAFSELVERIKRKQNLIRSDLNFKLGRRFSFQVFYQNNLHRYVEPQYKSLLDRTETLAGPIILFKIFPKTSLLLESNWGIIDYKENPNDSEYLQGFLGIEGKIAPKTMALAKFGWHQRQYKQSPGEKASSFVTSVALTVRPRQRTDLKLIIDRSLIESIYAVNKYYYSNRIIVRLAEKIGRKWNLSLGASYELNAYPEETTLGTRVGKREDNLFGGRINLGYQIQKWLSLKSGYQYRQRDSNFDLWDYKNNRGQITLEIKF